MNDRDASSNQSNATRTPKASTSRTPQVSREAVIETVSSGANQVRKAALGMVGSARSRLQGDDPARIESECGYLASFTQSERVEVPHHAVQAFAAAGMAAGLLHFETPIMRFTRGHMDIDHGVFQRLWRQVFPESNVAVAVDRFMDHVPGSDIAGGTFHRLHHGHDLNALVQIMEEHSAEGAVQWLNHVVLRDFWTPHGIPYLPGGSGTIYDWLINSTSISKSMAANLLTINAVEFFAGLSALRLTVLAVNGIKQLRTQRAIRGHWQEGERRDESGNLDGAYESYKKALDLSGRDPTMSLQFAIRQLSTAAQLDTVEASAYLDRTYRHANAVMLGTTSKATDTMPFQGGTLISIRGLAGYLMVAGLPGAFKHGSTREIPMGDLRDSISSFRQAAARLRTQWHPTEDRTISAALNELLALELSTHLNSPADHESPLTMRRDILGSLYPESDPNSATGRFIERLIQGVDRTYPITGLAT